MRRLRELWLELARGTPGRRFRDRYHRHDGVRHAALLAIGVAAIIVGLILMVTPGPGLVFVGVGAALVATESRRAAELLDRLELFLRRFW